MKSGTAGNKRSFLTYILIPRVTLGRLGTDHCLTQILINQGANPTYFQRFGITPIPQGCPLCGMKATIDSLHLIIFCESMEEGKRCL